MSGLLTTNTLCRLASTTNRFQARWSCKSSGFPRKTNDLGIDFIILSHFILEPINIIVTAIMKRTLFTLLIALTTAIHLTGMHNSLLHAFYEAH